MGNHEFCINCGANDLHEGIPCDPESSEQKSKMHNLTITTLSAQDFTDGDQLLLHAAFQVLVDHNRSENLAEYVDLLEHDKVADPAFIADRCPYFNEALVLYNWWTVDRPSRIDPWGEKVLGRMTGEEALIEEDRQYAEDTDMLVRLVKIREILWS